MRSVCLLLWVIALLVPLPTAAEIYKWVDRNGKVHFSDTLGSIPPEYRHVVEERNHPVPLPRQETLLRPLAPDVPARALLATPPTYTVPLRRDGNALLVEAMVGSAVPLRLLLDTGAELTVLSTATARRLALNLKEAAVIPLRSASGVFFAPLLKVPSLTVGEATLTDVEVIVHDATPGLDGLLGMSFLGSFLVTISTSTERLVLTPLVDAAEPDIYGGHPKDWWVRKFRFYRTQIDSLRNYLGGRYAPEVERTLRYLRTELDALDRQASLAGVPRRWRD